MNKAKFLKAMQNMSNIDANTLLLLHCEGANGSTAFTDASPYAASVTATGNAAISTARAKFGLSSVLFSAAGDWINGGSVSIGTGAFTYDCWIYPTNYSSVRIIFSLGGSNATGGFSFVIRTSGVLGLSYNSVSQAEGSTAITLNAWHHVALVGSGIGTYAYRLYLDGKLETQIYSGGYNLATNSIAIARNPGATNQTFVGNMDEIRFSNVARWVGSTYQVPSFPYA